MRALAPRERERNFAIGKSPGTCEGLPGQCKVDLVHMQPNGDWMMFLRISAYGALGLASEPVSKGLRWGSVPKRVQRLKQVWA